MPTLALSAARLRVALFVVAGFSLGAVTAMLVLPSARERLLTPVKTISVGRALVGGPFTLTDHTGKRVSDADFRGRFMLVTFGFTFCPDVCPSELQLITAALDRLGADAERIVPLFITVDPERDTPSQLATYVASFSPRFIGLTGSAAEIAAVAKDYRVYVRKASDPKSTAGYTMDHSALMYLMGPDGLYRAHFTPGISVEALAQRLAGELR